MGAVRLFGGYITGGQNFDKKWKNCSFLSVGGDLVGNLGGSAVGISHGIARVRLA